MATPGNRLILQGFGGPRLITQGFGPKLAYRNAFYYDKKGNVTCVEDPDDGLTYYTYDKVNRMTSVLNPWGEATYYEYTPDSEVSARIVGNGAVTYYDYDLAGRVSEVVNLKSDLSVISSFEYQRDCVGNPLSIVREDGSVTYYDYDKKYQLTEEIQVDPYGATVYAWTWDYDKTGNRTVQVANGVATYYEYNAGNELVTEVTGSATTYYQYDHRGNQTAKQEPGGTTYYQYNHQNLLTEIDLPDGSSNQFGYDGDSKRVWVNDSQGARRMVYQGPDMLKLFQEKDDSGNTQAQYTMGLGLESMRRGSASSFYHYDALGSTQELTDGTETVTDTYRYNAWGEVLAETGNTVNPHSYVGRSRYYRAADGDLLMLGVRQYSPNLGRFISPEAGLRFPVALAGLGLGGYLYASEAPVTWIDPTGWGIVYPDPGMGGIGSSPGLIGGGGLIGVGAGGAEGAIGAAEPPVGLIVIIIGLVGLITKALEKPIEIPWPRTRCPETCTEQHPTWPLCPADLVSDPFSAAMRPPVQWNLLINRNVWQMVGCTGCSGSNPTAGCLGGAPGTWETCSVVFMNKYNPSGWEIRNYSVKCCACCFPQSPNEGRYCENLHPSGGYGGQLPLP